MNKFEQEYQMLSDILYEWIELTRPSSLCESKTADDSIVGIWLDKHNFILSFLEGIRQMQKATDLEVTEP